ncbi:hypothetical protein L3D22_04540 [Lysobacter soli]|uniref:hypothetical protein n=1 Tax=Lysobacter soli TaxID=453783 RepID=UPI00209DF208|nr:hypothetical protein [Lysobacter soli]UTA55110.1 hypothetical protein L3D22_04540 [Lysobacter soli]
MKSLNLFLLLVAVLTTAACGRTPSIEGKWAVDIDETVKTAMDAGIPMLPTRRIHEVYDGGQLEITGDILVMRVAGYPDAISRNYTIISATGNCYGLEINGSQGVHKYCVDRGRLTVDDPNANLRLIYRQASR